MNDRKFLDTTQPQTLVIATLLLYLNAGLLVFYLLLYGFGSLLGIGLAVALGFGAYGIANEKKWGYSLAIVAAVVNALLPFLVFGGVNILTLIFDVALVILLLHPMSRDYQRIWFS